LLTLFLASAGLAVPTIGVTPSSPFVAASSLPKVLPEPEQVKVPTSPITYGIANRVQLQRDKPEIFTYGKGKRVQLPRAKPQIVHIRGKRSRSMAANEQASSEDPASPQDNSKAKKQRGSRQSTYGLVTLPPTATLLWTTNFPGNTPSKSSYICVVYSFMHVIC
jgi:hypothetical protein